MDQHEKDWLDLGRQLRDFQPVGQPSEDFLAFQQLQREKKPRRFAWWTAWWILPAFLLMFSTAYHWQDTLLGKVNAEPSPTTELLSAGVKPEESNTINENANTQATAIQSQESAALGVGLSLEKPKRTYSALAPQPSHDVKKVDISPVSPVSAERKPRKFTPPSEDRQPNPEQILPLFASPEREAEADRLAIDPPPKSLLPAETLVPRPIDKLPVESKLLRMTTRNAQGGNRPRLTFGTGVSSHWRGERFLQDVDRGLYVNLGLYQPVGQRFGLEAQIGYRAHDLNVPVLNDAKEPWSYHKDEIHNTGHMGELRRYVYEGIVESHRAAEFSLLVHYQLQPKISLHLGARYALPAIKFRQLVHGPDDENPFSDFIEGQEIVKYKDYGGILGLNYRLTTHLSLQGEVHLGLVDLIENAAQDGEQFNRSNSLSVGVRYSFD